MGTQLPPSIEIFRPGRHTDDSGAIHEFTAADVAAMAAAYEPALREAPLTVGHPEHNLPAYGWATRLVVNDAGRLAMDTHQVEPQFAEMVAAGRFKKRSASFYPPKAPNNPKPGTWYLRHVAFLGAQPPAVAGLTDIAFSEGDSDGAISFSEGGGSSAQTTHQESSMEDKEKLAAAEAAAKASDEARIKAEKATADALEKLAQFSEAQIKTRDAGFVSFAEAQFKAGKLKRPDASALPGVLSALADAKPVEFAEGGATKKVDPAEWLKSFIESGKPVVSFGEFAPGSADGGEQASVKGLTDAEIDTRAKAYAVQHKVQYAEALTAVCSFTD
jgi:hypothetical protein